MKKAFPIVSLILLLIILICSISIYFWHEQNYIQIESEDIPRDTTHLALTSSELPDIDSLIRLTALKELDIRSVELSIEEFNRLREILPKCKIIWNVPFQGSYLPESTEVLRISTLSTADFESIRYLPQLAEIQAEGCTDYDAMLKLKEAYPSIKVTYTVSVNGTAFPDDTICMQLENADITELSAALPYLPHVREIHFIGNIPDYEEIYILGCQYSQISFLYELTICGKMVSSTVEILDLSGIPMTTTEEVESKLKYFPNLRKVDMCDCGIPSEQMDVLAKRYPNIRFIWTIKVRDGNLRTDAISFIPYKLGYDLNKPLYDADLKELKYCVDLICLDLGHMKIRDVSFLEYMPNMQYLVLVDMPCKDFSALANLKQLIYLELFNVQFTQHELLLEMKKLQDLNISSTPTRDIEVLRQMDWLERLWITRTKLNSAQIQELKEALPNTQVVANVAHSTAGNWRDNDNYRKMRDLLGMHYMK